VRFEPGQTILRRNIHKNGRIAAVESTRLVRDDEHGVLTWTAAGSQVMRRYTLSGELTRYMPIHQRSSIPTMLGPGEWRDTNVLVLTPPDVAHSIWWFFDTAGAFLGWYVNLESPATRWFGGLDTRDQALDIWVEPDRCWTWKDEDEFAERTGHPDYWTAEEATGIRAEGEKLTALIEAGVHPFDGSLTDFRPDKDWAPTTLPPHWDLPAAPIDLPSSGLGGPGVGADAEPGRGQDRDVHGR
jgi:hypothetical protein